MGGTFECPCQNWVPVGLRLRRVSFVSHALFCLVPLVMRAAPSFWQFSPRRLHEETRESPAPQHFAQVAGMATIVASGDHVSGPAAREVIICHRPFEVEA